MTTKKEHAKRVREMIRAHGGATFLGRPYNRRETYKNVIGNWLGMTRWQLADKDISKEEARRKMEAFNLVLASSFGMRRMSGGRINTEKEISRYSGRN